MAGFFWIAGDGTWSTAANWTANAVPGSSDDAFISAPGGYTVSITSPISVGSVTISDAQAVLAINDPGVTQSVTGGFSNAGTVAVDNAGGNGGSNLSIGGTLTNSNFMVIGNGGLSASTTVTANALSNTGRIDINGNTATGTTDQATLDIATAAASFTGNVNLSGDARLEYGSGGITQIGDGTSNGGDLFIDGANAFAEIGATNSNSALTGLTTIAGNGVLDLRDGTSVTATSGLAVNGGSARLKVDAYGGRGGSTVTIGGNLVSSSFGSFGDGGVSVGNGNMSVADLLTVNGTLTNTGATVSLSGGSQAGATARMQV